MQIILDVLIKSVWYVRLERRVFSNPSIWKILSLLADWWAICLLHLTWLFDYKVYCYRWGQYKKHCENCQLIIKVQVASSMLYRIMGWQWLLIKSNNILGIFGWLYRWCRWELRVAKWLWGVDHFDCWFIYCRFRRVFPKYWFGYLDEWEYL